MPLTSLRLIRYPNSMSTPIHILKMHTLKLFFVLILISLCLTIKAQDTAGAILSLDGYWSFKIDPNNIGETRGWAHPDQPKIGWDSLAVPGNWDTRNEYAHYTGKAWYHKSIEIPSSWKGKKLYLKFEGIYFDSKVWVNGKLLGANNNGFLPFEFNVSELVNRVGKNTIVVCADNSFRLGAVWNWGGIRRSVKLLAYNEVRISSQHITASADLEKGTAQVNVKVNLVNDGRKTKQVEGTVDIYALGVVKKSVAFKANLAAGTQGTVVVDIALNKKDIHLWHFDAPFLYKSVVNVNDGKENLHQSSDRFGIRKIEVDHKNYTFKLNGENVRLMGFNLVPDDRTTGNTLPLWRIKADIDDMKALGCNMARLTHFSLPKEMYDYLDERGMLIFPELPLWGADDRVNPDNEVPKDWLKRLVNDNYNHPSIIGWSVGNEIGHNPKASAYVKETIALARTLDPSRLAVVVSHTPDKAADVIAQSDLGMINRYNSKLKPVTEKIHFQHPNKLLFYSEYGVAQTSEDLNTDFNFKAMLDSIRQLPYLMGASLWTYNDYRSNYLGTKSFSETRPWGIVNDFRQRKNAWYAAQKEYAPLKVFKIDPIQKGKVNSTTVLTLTPRNVLDLPAYSLKDYRVVWRIKDQNGQTLFADFIELPLTKPGGQTLKKEISWPEKANAALMEVALVSPLNYTLIDTTAYFIKPKAPSMISSIGVGTLSNDFKQKPQSIRVVFEKSTLAEGYQLKYGKDKLVSETPVTINPFIDVKGLDFSETYNFALVSVNSFGKSELGQIQKIATQFAPAPPLIRYTEAADQGFFIGYETLEDDYLFEVRYSTVQGNYADAGLIKSTNKGLLFVPGLENGQKYYFQMRRLRQNAYLSPWSEELTIMPDGGQLPASPNLDGIIHKVEQAVVLFTPVKKAIGYLLNYRIAGEKSWREVMINAAQINQYRLRGLKGDERYEFKLAAINAAGKSEFSKVKQSF
ncbi:MAG: hypothetical protein EON51_01675 [Acinetobacter sp.]|nr:MAG: hypothetical protein EON51_01675 [Acinetobacter sp.]